MIILILLSLIFTLIMSNGVVLRRLRVELQLLEEKQKRKFEMPPQTAGQASSRTEQSHEKQ